MESRLFGLTTGDLKSLAYQLAVTNNKKHCFNAENERAGKDWLLGFLKRHPELSIRKPESTSAARAAGFNKTAVDNFFKLLGKVYDEKKIPGDRVYNTDETGVSIVPKSRCKIIAKTGRKQVGALSSAERGATITVEVCFNATGHYMPVMMVFPRKRMKPELMVNAPQGAWGVCSDSGWITTELFLEWFEKFIVFSGATKDRPVLLLLDGHATHIKNINLINLARENGVEIIAFPPHTTHRLQPLDVAFMKPLSTYYDQAVNSWLRSNPGLVVTSRQVAELFGKAFIQAATMTTSVNAFRKCGIWPFDPSVFTESDFIASETTDIPIVENSTPPPLPPQTANTQVHTDTQIQADDDNPITNIHSSNTNTNNMNNTEPGCSHWQTQQSPQKSKDPRETIFAIASPKQLLPVPVTTQTKRVSRKRGKTAIITSSPYKSELEEEMRKKHEAEQGKENKKSEKQKQLVEKQKKIREALGSNQVSKQQNKKRAKQAKWSRKNSSDESNEETDNTPCLYCNGLYLESIEGWIMCTTCSRWAHCSCAGVEDEDDEATHVCALCCP